MSIYYTAYENGHRYKLPGANAEWSADCDSDADLEFLAEEAAADYHSEHDGWERQWPLTITLYDGKDGPELGRFTVEREYEPSFSAYQDDSASGRAQRTNNEGGSNASS